MADTPDTNEVRLHGQFTQVDENGDVTVLYPNTTVDDITGILPIEKGGTGSSSEQDFMQNIINNILNDNDLTNVSQLYSKFITSVDERPTNLNSFTNPGWYYFTSSTAPEGYQNHPAIYNGDATEPTAGFLFVITVRYKTCQFWISANYIGTTGNKKRCIYQREASINSEQSYAWSKWTYLHGDSNATQVYYVTYKGDSSIEYMYQDSYPGEAAIFKYETVDGSYTQHNGDIIIAECNFPETVKEIQLQIDDTEPTQIYTDSEGSSAVKLYNNNYKKITNGIYIFLYRTRVYHVIGQLHSTFNLATNGLVPKPDSTDTTKFLRGDGTWVIPDNTTYTLMGNSTNNGWEVSLTSSSGSSTSTIVPTFSGSSSGLVPTSNYSTQDLFLRGDSSWATIPRFSGSSSGLVPTSNSSTQNKFLRGDGSWVIPDNTTYTLMGNSTNTGWEVSLTPSSGSSTSTIVPTFSGSSSGLVPKPSSGDTTKFLNAGGSWTEPTNTTYGVFSTSANGLVPKPSSGDTTKFLNAGGTWTVPSGTSNGTTYGVFSTTANGLVPKPSSASTTKFLNANGGWTEPTGTTYSTFSTSANGLVPKPSSGDTTKFLNANGGWTEPTGTYTHPSYTAKTPGLYKITVNNTGHVSAATAVTNSDINGIYGPINTTNGDDRALIMGNNNEIHTATDLITNDITVTSFILGCTNKIGTNTSSGNKGSVVIGGSNEIKGPNRGIICGNDNTITNPVAGNQSVNLYTYIFGSNIIAPNHGGVFIGRYNNIIEETSDETNGYYYDNNYVAFCIGNGKNLSTAARSNAFRVDYDGTVYASSTSITQGADYAEFVKPWFDDNIDNEDRVGYMVTIKDGYLHKANDGDYIIGITSGNPSFVGNGDEDYYWKYERDEFNRIVYELVDETKEEIDENGNIIYVPTGNKISIPKISSNYNPELQSSYVERKKRSEWSYVGMRGIVPVRDDGTCEAGGFCKCGIDGIATKSERGLDTYYVIERINDHVVSVEVK